MSVSTLKTLTAGDITREALRILKNSNKTLKTVSRQYDDRFAKTGSKNGGTLQIRQPNRYTVGTGRTITPQATDEKTTALVVGTQKNVACDFFSDDLTLSLDDFSSRILKPAMSILASTISAAVATEMVKGFHQLVGTAGTTPSAYLTYGQAGELLDWQTAPDDGNRTILLNPTMMVATADAQKGLFSPAGAISSQYESGVVEEMTGFMFKKEQGLPTITNGTRASYVTGTGTPLTSGTAVLAVITGTGTMSAGEVFTIAGVFEVNPDTGVSTGRLKQFVVAADYAGGAGNVTLGQIIYTSGARMNVSGAIPASTALTFVGNASTGYPRGLAFHRDSTVLAMADLEMPKNMDMAYRASIDGISLRFIRGFDITADNFISRFDVLYGIKVVRPEWGVQIIG